MKQNNCTDHKNFTYCKHWSK